jgi:hypothetical protein
MVVQCCLCRRVRNGKQWVEPTPTDLVDEHVSHGYCPVCAAKAFAEIQDLLASKSYTPRAAAG